VHPVEAPVELEAEEAEMLNEAIAEADADPTRGVRWEDVRRDLRKDD
jgi:anti-sigma factor RsiW